MLHVADIITHLLRKRERVVSDLLPLSVAVALLFLQKLVSHVELVLLFQDGRVLQRRTVSLALATRALHLRLQQKYTCTLRDSTMTSACDVTCMKASCCSMMSLYASICRRSFSVSACSNFRLRSESFADVIALRFGDVTLVLATGATRTGDVCGELDLERPSLDSLSPKPTKQPFITVIPLPFLKL